MSHLPAGQVVSAGAVLNAILCISRHELFISQSSFLSTRCLFFLAIVYTMKLPLFFLLGLCISKATAFGLYGCYERLLYWQAYQMDEDSHDKKIATACARDSITAKVVGPITGGRCNLRQFLYYIADNQDEKAVVADKNTLKDSDLAKERTDLDEVAKKMYHAGMGEPYNPSHIYQGLRSTSKIHELIQNVAGYVSIAIPNESVV